MGVAYAFCSGLSETYTGLFSIREFDTGSLKSAAEIASTVRSFSSSPLSNRVTVSIATFAA